MSKELATKIDDMKELFNERIGTFQAENSKEHTMIWEQVKSTNGRVRLIEKTLWFMGGAIAILGLIFSPSAIQIILKFI
jgi:hypothetical protein